MQLVDDADGALDSWARFCDLSDELFGGAGDLSAGPRLAPVVADLCARGLAELLRDQFIRSLEVTQPPRFSTHTHLLRVAPAARSIGGLSALHGFGDSDRAAR
jgi:hypothetical protein